MQSTVGLSGLDQLNSFSDGLLERNLAYLCCYLALLFKGSVSSAMGRYRPFFEVEYWCLLHRPKHIESHSLGVWQYQCAIGDHAQARRDLNHLTLLPSD